MMKIGYAKWTKPAVFFEYGNEWEDVLWELRIGKFYLIKWRKD